MLSFSTTKENRWRGCYGSCSFKKTSCIKKTQTTADHPSIQKRLQLAFLLMESPPKKSRTSDLSSVRCRTCEYLTSHSVQLRPVVLKLATNQIMCVYIRIVGRTLYDSQSKESIQPKYISRTKKSFEKEHPSKKRRLPPMSALAR